MREQPNFRSRVLAPGRALSTGRLLPLCELCSRRCRIRPAHLTTLFTLVIGSWAAAQDATGQAGGHPSSQVAVVIGPQADELERQAAQELCRYLDKLFGVKVQPTTELPQSGETI